LTKQNDSVNCDSLCKVDQSISTFNMHILS